MIVYSPSMNTKHLGSSVYTQVLRELETFFPVFGKVFYGTKIPAWLLRRYAIEKLTIVDPLWRRRSVIFKKK